jgi:hypothetical protein
MGGMVRYDKIRVNPPPPHANNATKIKLKSQDSTHGRRCVQISLNYQHNVNTWVKGDQCLIDTFLMDIPLDCALSDL